MAAGLAGVNAFPTFQFYDGGRVARTIRGADRGALQGAVASLAKSCEARLVTEAAGGDTVGAPAGAGGDAGGGGGSGAGGMSADAIAALAASAPLAPDVPGGSSAPAVALRQMRASVTQTVRRGSPHSPLPLTRRGACRSTRMR